MLKEMTASERAMVWARQRGFDLQVEAINQCDVKSKWAHADMKELYTLTEARASAVIKQEEDLTVHAHHINQRARDVEELEGLLQEQEGLDDITLHHELEALSTHETTLERREAYLDREWKALEDAHAQILVRKLDTNSREASLRD
jgi:hypothetical protein